jgi:hypothetical protein
MLGMQILLQIPHTWVGLFDNLATCPSLESLMPLTEVRLLLAHALLATNQNNQFLITSPKLLSKFSTEP